MAEEGANLGVEQMRETKPWYRSAHLVRLYALMLAPMVTCAAWGFDLSMTSSLQALDQFNERFDHPSGSRLGFYGACTQVGGMGAMLCVPYVMDRFGRRLPCFAGALIVVAMAFMQTFALNFGMFIGGKVLLGFGAYVAQIAAPSLITELAHPQQRSRITNIYQTTIYVGLVAGAWIAYGTQHLPGNAQWQIPTALQAALPAYEVLMVWFCPESPRWLVMRGRREEGYDLLVKWHGGGRETELVRQEYREIIAGIEQDETALRFRWADIKKHLSARGNLHRLFICTVVAVGSQCCGSSLISAYLPTVLDSVGMTSTKDKTLINGIVNIWSWVVGVTFALLMPRIPRRPLFLISTAGMVVTFAIWTGLAAVYDQTGKKSYGIGVVAVIFLYNGFYGCCWLPMTVAYPIEVVTTKQRGLYFSWTFFVISSSNFIVNYVNPVGLQNLGWKYYTITVAFNCLVLACVFFGFVETKGLSLEQIAAKFDGKLEDLVEQVEHKREIEGEFMNDEQAGHGKTSREG
ncbi:hypothetical protein VUR80DRAFT_3023 [Thermomyces stellatus]